MMTWLETLYDKTDFSAIIQIAILYLVIYSILKAAKGSRFGQLLMGVGILASLLVAFTYLFNFDVLSRIIQFLLVYLAISSVVLFQPEIRRILAQMGALGFGEKPKHDTNGAATAEFITEVILSLAKQRVGALFAFENGISLRSYEETGITTNATISHELIMSILTPPMPLHDGGCIIREGRLSAAHCIFPVSNNPNLISSGMRHRAAVGLSEETDAVVIVVSEESGAVSVANNGKLYRYKNDTREQSLKRWVTKAMGVDNESGKLSSLIYSLLPQNLKK
ncbi:MAG: diadenylate cyclase [Kiritimatiellae bacterium]|nr:diadenylate cyclase [Kiritimatiellia bacterium]